MRNKTHAGAKQPAFKQATDMLARTAAVGITFFGTGPIFAATNDRVRVYVERAYDSDLTGLASLLWFGLLGISIFAFSTLFIAAVVQLVSLKATQFALKLR